MQEVSVEQFVQWMGSSSRVIGAARSVAVDSRTVKPGSLFFALKGERADGHNFLHEATANGAVAAVVDHEIENAPLPLIVVGNTTRALQEAAHHYMRTVSKARIAAITGSVGKTTVKGFVHTLLASKHRVCASPGNYNSQVGLPLALFEVSGEEEWLVLEMALSGPGHIGRLVEIAPPTIAMLTTVEITHTAGFESYEEISVAKGEIFSGEGCELGIFCYDIPRAEEVAQIGSCPKQTFSVRSRAAGYRFDFLSDVVAIWKGEERLFQARCHLPGEHSRYNVCCAALVAHACGMEWDEIAAVVHQLELPERRFQQVVKRGVLVVNDSYNACERSMVAALKSLPEPAAGGERIALLGSMGELGRYAEPCHRAVGECALEQVNRLICFGVESEPMADVWRAAGRSVERYDDRAEAVERLQEMAREGDVVLVKGANVHELWKVVDAF